MASLTLLFTESGKSCMNKYSRREWLNDAMSEATGSVAAFDGVTKRAWDGEDRPSTFLEIADCNDKVTLHPIINDGPDAFIRKLRLLAEVVTEFADYLEKK